MKLSEKTQGQSSASLGTLLKKTSLARSHADEPLNFIREARMNWEKGINDELLAIATELKKPLITLQLVHLQSSEPDIDICILQSARSFESIS